MRILILHESDRRRLWLGCVRTRWLAYTRVLWLGLAFAATFASADPLETLIITASRIETTEDQATIPVLTYTKEEITQRKAVLLEELLKGTAGLHISRGGGWGGTSALRIRGAESNHVKLLIDGIDADDVALSTPVNLDFLSTAGISQVSILKGPQSGVWGSDALAGIVQLDSTPASGERSAQVTLGTGARGTDIASGELAFSEGGSHVSASLSRFSTDGINAVLQGSERDGYLNATGHVNVGLKMGAHTKGGAVLRYTDVEYDYDPAPADGDLSSEGRQLQASLWLRGEYLTDSDSDSASAGGGLGKGNGLSYLARLTGFDSKHRFFEGKVFQNNYQGQRTKLTLQSTYRKHAHRITLAGEYQQESYRQLFAALPGLFFSAPDSSYGRTDSTLSLVGEYGLTLGPVLATWSMRHEQNDQWQDDASYRLAVRYAVRPSTRLSGTLATGTTNPTFLERYGFIPNTFRGNSNLKPEQAQSFSLSLAQRWAATEFSATWFDTKLRNEIQTIFGSSTSTVANRAGKSYRKGLELGVNTSWLNGQLAFSGQYTWLNATEAANAGQQTEIRRPEHSSKWILDIKRSWFNGQIGWVYTGSQIDTDFSSFPAKSVRLDDYSLVHLTAQAQIAKRLALYVKLDNVLDENYQEVFGYRSIGRQWLAGVTLDWGGK